ncbi:MAG TPA: GNAT family protein [Alphaproteobacteria bacterium]|nr:GNAT family protein [Alphaproteobacteria bacterium]HNS43926.1 GNAT family protein [Alphaproteobacteria bacterium]
MRKQEIVKLLPLKTERTIIRQPTMEDADMIQKAKEDRETDLRRWMSWTDDHGMSREGLEEWLKLQSENSPLLGLIALDKKTGDYIMSSGLDGEDENFSTVHSGYWMTKSYEGKGIAFEVMTRIIDFAFNTAGIERVEMAYYEGNIRSRNLMERLGLTHNKTEPKAHTSHLTGEKLDVYWYSISKTEK